MPEKYIKPIEKNFEMIRNPIYSSQSKDIAMKNILQAAIPFPNQTILPNKNQTNEPEVMDLNLTTLENSQPEKYIEAGYDYQKYEKEILEIANNPTITKNEKVAALATYMATKFPKLPYFWGGGHGEKQEYFIGIDPDWGRDATIQYGGDEENYPVGSTFPKSLDCSSFVTWCLVNANVDISSVIEDPENDYCLITDECKKLGQSYEITSKDILDNIKVGDIAYKKGHVGIVTNIDWNDQTVTVAHISGSGKGMNLTTISTKTGLIVEDHLGPMPENDTTNRVGQPYFTNIISVDYNK